MSIFSIFPERSLAGPCAEYIFCSPVTRIALPPGWWSTTWPGAPSRPSRSLQVL